VVLSQFSVVGVCGSRRAPAALRAPAGALVRAALGSGCALACGCASGVDALAADAASRLSLFAAFGPGGVGALGAASSYDPDAAATALQRERAMIAVFEALAARIGVHAALDHCRQRFAYPLYAVLVNGLREDMFTTESEDFSDEVVK